MVLVMTKGGESSWSGPWDLGCTLEVFHVHSYKDQFTQPVRAECFYAALLPRRGPHIASHSVCPSVRLSVCPSVLCLFTLEPSYERTSKIVKLPFSIIGQRQPCGRVVSFVLFTFVAAYCRVISRTSLLLLLLQSPGSRCYYRQLQVLVENVFISAYQPVQLAY